jgi:hypothetical protein
MFQPRLRQPGQPPVSSQPSRTPPWWPPASPLLCCGWPSPGESTTGDVLRRPLGRWFPESHRRCEISITKFYLELDELDFSWFFDVRILLEVSCFFLHLFLGCQSINHRLLVHTCRNMKKIIPVDKEHWRFKWFWDWLPWKPNPILWTGTYQKFETANKEMIHKKSKQVLRPILQTLVQCWQRNWTWPDLALSHGIYSKLCKLWSFLRSSKMIETYDTPQFLCL